MLHAPTRCPLDDSTHSYLVSFIKQIMKFTTLSFIGALMCADPWIVQADLTTRGARKNKARGESNDRFASNVSERNLKGSADGSKGKGKGGALGDVCDT